MRKSIGAAAAALVVAGTAFMACGGASEYEPDYEQIRQHGNSHALMNCTQTEILLRGRQGLETTGEDRRQIEIECRRRLAR